MKYLFLFFCISFCSCDKDDLTYIYSIELNGDNSSYFSEQGESRQFIVTVFREAKINEESSGQKKRIDASIISNIEIEGEQFIISNVSKEGASCHFELTANENQQEVSQKCRIIFTLTDTQDAISKTYEFQQKASLIERQYAITTKMPQPFVIPAEGGAI